MEDVRILFIADTHLGFDLPFRPKVQRRRRGPDFFSSFQRALAPALRGAVDAVVHGGDLLYRSRVPNRLVEMAFAPLRRVADGGVDVFIVPGNHERSHIPHGLWALHPRIHVFDRARAFTLMARGQRVGLFGFPFCGRGIRRRFRSLLNQSGLGRTGVDIAVLCLHECVEGASVGPNGFVFRSGEDVVRAADLPTDVALVLAGHIHRHQWLTAASNGQRLPAPVLYAGSTERTSFAEKDETKGYVIVRLTADRAHCGSVQSAAFHPLPTRPMIFVTQRLGSSSGQALTRRLAALAAGWPADAVVKIQWEGTPSAEQAAALRASALRAVVPATMNVQLSGSVRAQRAGRPSR